MRQWSRILENDILFLLLCLSPSSAYSQNGKATLRQKRSTFFPLLLFSKKDRHKQKSHSVSLSPHTIKIKILICGSKKKKKKKISKQQLPPLCRCRRKEENRRCCCVIDRRKRRDHVEKNCYLVVLSSSVCKYMASILM